jgi:very-short-patch-repair endonuclease
MSMSETKYIHASGQYVKKSKNDGQYGQPGRRIATTENTGLEIPVQRVLKLFGIPFRTHGKNGRYGIDIVIEPDLCVHIDGWYHHRTRKHKINREKNNSSLYKQDKRPYALTQHEIEWDFRRAMDDKYIVPTNMDSLPSILDLWKLFTYS